MHRPAFVAVFGLALVVSVTSQAGWDGEARGLLGAKADYSILHLAKKNQDNKGQHHKKNKKEGKNNNDSNSESSGDTTEKTETSQKGNPPPASSGGTQTGEAPSATLLLTYLEVDTNKPGGDSLFDPKSGK